MTAEELKIILQNRTTTSFGVSIGTGLLLESMFDPIVDRYDPDRPIPPRVEMKKYPYWLINVYTLIRNILTSLTEKVDETSIEVLSPLLMYIKIGYSCGFQGMKR